MRIILPLDGSGSYDSRHVIRPLLSPAISLGTFVFHELFRRQDPRIVIGDQLKQILCDLSQI